MSSPEAVKMNSGAVTPPPSKIALKIALFNANGISNKLELITQFIQKQQINLLFITETWIKPDGAIPHQVISHSSRSTNDKKGSRGIAVIGNTTVDTIFASNQGDLLICKSH